MILALFALAIAADWTPLAGTWVHSGVQAELTLRDQAVARAADEFNLLIRGVAEPRLQKSAPRPSGYFIHVDGDQITIGIAGKTPRTSTLGAPPSQFVPDGDDKPVKIQRLEQGESLVSIVIGENGTLSSSFRRVKDKLVVSYRVTSDKLDDPVTYRLTFVPAS